MEARQSKKVRLEGQCAMCDGRYAVTPTGKIRAHAPRGEPCSGLDWPPLALACKLNQRRAGVT